MTQNFNECKDCIHFNKGKKAWCDIIECENKPELKVTGWTHWSDGKYKDLEDENSDLFALAYESVINELKKTGYKFTGTYHQYGKFGVPIINNKYRFELSQRSWGSVVAEAHPDKKYETDHESYIKWYCVAIEEEITPEGAFSPAVKDDK